MLLQAERMHTILPFLCLTVAANALAMAIAVNGALPWWQQLVPPFIIIGGCLAMLMLSRHRGSPKTPKDALRRLQGVTAATALLGLVAGFWSVNAFVQTDQHQTIVAPVFIGFSALVAATCMLNAPRAAIVGIATTITPLVIEMLIYNDLGVRAMAVMLVIIGVLQGGVVLAKFRETVAMLSLQHKLNQAAESDSLTKLDNRFAFMRKLEAMLASNEPLLVALADLDGFKQVNDQYGHQAGDFVLIEVARRMRQLAPRAVSVARLGGDEFALLFDASKGTAQIEDALNAIKATVPLPVVHNTALFSVGLSLGHATSTLVAQSSTALLGQADQRLYDDKAVRRDERTARLRAR